MIDMHVEQLVLLKRAAKLFPSRPHLATLYRWADGVQVAPRRGRRKAKAGEPATVKLDTLVIGDDRYTSRETAQRLTWRAVDVRPRPDRVATSVEWHQGDVRLISPRIAPGPGLVVAHELLDDIPCDIVEIDDRGARRLVLVDPITGAQELGPTLDDQRACGSRHVDGARLDAWCEQWWPRREPAARVEVGVARDEAWSAIAGLVTDGIALAVDYAHVASQRADGLFDGGTLTGYRAGHLVSPIPDGSCNITAHVALDACAPAVSAHSAELFPSGDGDDYWWLVQALAR